MLILRSLVCVFVFVIVGFVFADITLAQGVRITSSSEQGSLNGETIYSEVNYSLELRAVPPANNQGGTWQWTIAGNFQFVNGTSTSRNVQIKWTTAGAAHTVQVTYVGPNGTSSATVNIMVRTNAQRVELTTVPCSQEGMISSGAYIIPTTIQIDNTTNKTIKTYLLDSNGQRTVEWTYPPGVGWIWYSAIGHPWIVTDENGNCLGIYQGIRETGRVTVANVSKIEFEKTLSDSEPLSLNPNAEGGRRFYPDKKDPDESVSRSRRSFSWRTRSV